MVIPEVMKAAVLMGPDHLVVKEVPTPAPGPMEVLLKVESAACCSTDVALMAKPFPGQPPYGNFIPVHEYAGTVAGLGETVDEFRVGDRVAVEAHLGCLRCRNCRLGNFTACLNYGTKKHRANGMTSNGGFAQYVRVPQKYLWRLPDDLSDSHAALTEPLAVAVRGHRKGRPATGEKVLIYGCGAKSFVRKTYLLKNGGYDGPSKIHQDEGGKNV